MHRSGSIRSHEQMHGIDDLVTFWRAGQALIKAHG
jgi:hypothetical protein